MLVELLKRVDQGYVNARPSGRLTIFDYSNHCVFERAWDEITLQARGLVLDDQGQVVARPFRKFFNLGERPETRLEALPAETPELSEKLDGSMIIVFHDDVENRWRAITRGCWENAQTIYANEWLENHGHRLEPGQTYLFELIAPWNRIVIPYAKTELVLLGIVDTATGKDLSYAETAVIALRNGLRPVGFESKPLVEIDLNDPKVRDKEGFVARYSNGLRVKLKYAEYLSLHKVLTGLSIKGLWELLSTGKEPTFENVPDEFMDWYRKQRDGLRKAYSEVETRATEAFASVPAQPTRREYATEFLKHKDLAPILFLMLDHRDYTEVIWDRIKPKGQTATFQQDDG